MELWNRPIPLLWVCLFVCLFVCVIPLKLVSGHSDHTVSRVADVGRSRCLTNKRVGPGERKPKGACSRLNQRQIVTRKKNWQAVEQGQKPDRATQREQKQTKHKEEGQARRRRESKKDRKENNNRKQKRENATKNAGPRESKSGVRASMFFKSDVEWFSCSM